MKGNQTEELPVDIEGSHHQCQVSGDDVESRSSPAQPCSYVTHFDEIKRYFYTTISDPNLLPEDRQEHIYRLFLESKETESRFGFGSSIYFFVVDMILSIQLGPLLTPFRLVDANSPLLLCLFGIWNILKLRRFFAAYHLAEVRLSPHHSPSQRIYLETKSILQSTDCDCTSTRPEVLITHDLPYLVWSGLKLLYSRITNTWHALLKCLKVDPMFLSVLCHVTMD